MRPPQAGLLPALRRYLHLSQAQLAGLLGTTQAHVALTETSPRPRRRGPGGPAGGPPPGLAQALTTAPAHQPPPPHPPTLLPRRLQLWLELSRLEPGRATRQAQAAAGAARLALLDGPLAPTPHTQVLRLEAEAWTDALAQAELLLLTARCAGLRHELALLGGAPPGADGPAAV